MNIITRFGVQKSVAYMDRLPLYGLWASAGLMEIMIS